MFKQSPLFKFTTIVLGILLTGVLPAGYAMTHAENAAAARYLDAVLAAVDRAEERLPELTAIAEQIAGRHLKGGTIGTYWQNQSLGSELLGRAGNMIHIGHHRSWSEERTAEQQAHNLTILAFDRTPTPIDLNFLRQDAARGFLMIGMGPIKHPDIEPLVDEFDIFIDTETGADDRQVILEDGTRVGQINHIVHALHGWILMAETVGALTRQDKMPTMWRSYSWPDGREWGNRYLGKQQFHETIHVPPQPAGELGRQYINEIRSRIRILRHQEVSAIQKAGRLIGDEILANRKVPVAWEGHMPEGYVALRDDAAWCQAFQLHLFLEGQRADYLRKAPNGVLALRLGSSGIDPHGPPLFREKNQPWILVTGEHPDPEWQGSEADALHYVPLPIPFGDSCVTVEGYPFPLFASSGIIQAVGYESILVEAVTHARAKE